MPAPADRREPRGLAAILRRNWAWVSSTGYLYVTYVGLVQTWLHYDAFDVDIFAFSELSDFLLAAFHSPTSFYYLLVVLVYSAVIVPVLAVAIDYCLVKLNISMAPAGWTYCHRFLFLVVLLAAPFLASYLMNHGYNDDWKQQIVTDSERRFHVIFRTEQQATGHDAIGENLVLLGQLSSFSFLLRIDDRDLHHADVLVAPHTSIWQLRKRLRWER